ncbi:hypothetical protein Tco_1502357 [Tanacetum coccineum]
MAIGSEVQESKEKKVEGSDQKATGSRKKMLGRKRVGKEQQQESSKKQRLKEDKESDEVEEIEKDDEDALKKYLLHKEGLMVHYELIRADGTSKRYTSMIRLLQGIDREHLQTLWKLVTIKHGDIRPEDEHQRVLWGDLKKPAKPLTPDRDWNKTLPAAHGPIQPWISNLARKEYPHESFNELMDTPLDFSAFVLNRLKVDTLTPELLAGPTFELMKGSCKSLVELKYFLEEVCKATTDQLD